MKNFSTTCLVAFSLTFAVDASVSPSKEIQIEVHGHRGARAVRPENTLPAFAYALELGVDVLELDLGVTKDDVLVVSHDPVIDPKICLDSKGRRIVKEVPIRKLTLKQVKAFDCGTLRNPRFRRQKTVPGEKIPTLDEVFEMVRLSTALNSKTVRFNIETKIVPGRPHRTPGPKKFARLLLKSLKKNGVVSRTIVQSFDHRTLRAIRELEPSIQISALFDGSLPNLPLLAKDLSLTAVSPNIAWITADYVKQLKEMNVKIIPWTANRPEHWEALVALGVDGIITDDPKGLIDFLKKKNLR